MNQLTSERLASGKRALRFISDSANRVRLRAAGVGPQTPMIVCEWETPVSEVHSMLRLQDGRRKVLVAICRDEHILPLMASADEPEIAEFLKSRDIHSDSHIGMVYDTLTAIDRSSRLSSASVASAPERVLGQYSLAPA